jgi:hypothetical protein
MARLYNTVYITVTINNVYPIVKNTYISCSCTHSRLIFILIMAINDDVYKIKFVPFKVSVISCKMYHNYTELSSTRTYFSKLKFSCEN